MGLEDVIERGGSVELQLERMDREERDETRAYTSLEQWAEDVEDAIYRGVEKHSKSSIRAALVHVGYMKKRELILDIQRINDLQKTFKDFIKSYTPPRENQNEVSRNIKTIGTIDIEKADPETNYSDTDVSVPILRTIESKINDETGVSGLTERDILRVFHGEGARHSVHVHEGDKEQATILVKNAEEAVERERDKLEKQIASYIGRNICYIEHIIMEEWNEEAVYQLRDIYNAMRSEWRSDVKWHFDKMTNMTPKWREPPKPGELPEPPEGDGIDQ